MLYIFLIVAHFFGGFQPSEGFKVQDTADVVVTVDNIQDIKGELLIGIYNTKRSFRKVKRVYKYVVKAVGNDEEVLVLEDIPSGTYAIALYQDLNGNKKFDKNFMGVPKEPFGFSTNFLVRRRAPKFKEVTFSHEDNNNTELTISIQKW